MHTAIENSDEKFSQFINLFLRNSSFCLEMLPEHIVWNIFNITFLVQILLAVSLE